MLHGVSKKVSNCISLQRSVMSVTKMLLLLLHPVRHVAQVVKKYGSPPHIAASTSTEVAICTVGYLEDAITMNVTVRQRGAAIKLFTILPMGVPSSSNYSRAKLSQVWNYVYGVQ
jgi:hypothetical protein